MPRLFAAIALPDTLRSALASLRVEDPDVRWAPRDAMHLTVRFLGATDAVEAVTGALRAEALATPTLSLALAGFGRFPSRRAPRVLWVGVTGDVEPLAALARRVDRAVAPLGFAPEQRRYHPHITVGRVKRGGAPIALAALAGLGALGTFEATALVLFRSDLHPSGARHTPLAALPFGAHVRHVPPTG